MNKVVRKEIEDLIVSGRGKDEVELALKHCFDGVEHHQGTNNQFGAGAEKERQQCTQCNLERLGAVGVVVD